MDYFGSFREDLSPPAGLALDLRGDACIIPSILRNPGPTSITLIAKRKRATCAQICMRIVSEMTHHPLSINAAQLVIQNAPAMTQAIPSAKIREKAPIKSSTDPPSSVRPTSHPAIAGYGNPALSAMSENLYSVRADRGGVFPGLAGLVTVEVLGAFDPIPVV